MSLGILFGFPIICYHLLSSAMICDRRCLGMRRIDFTASSADRTSQDDRRSDVFDNDRHGRYDQYRNRPDYRDRQPDGGAVEAKYRDMANAGLPLGQPTSAERTSSDGQGHVRTYENGAIFWSPRTGAHEVHGAIRERYEQLGAETGRLGYPTSDEMIAPDGRSRVSRFERGSISWSPEAGVRVTTR
jgi:uncharacterized protein with LGFP repeats